MRRSRNKKTRTKGRRHCAPKSSTKQEALRKQKEEDEKRQQAQKEEEERKRQQAIKDEEEKKRQAEKDEEERQRKAAIKPASLPLGTPSDITTQKTAPTVGDAVPGKTFFQECDICPVMSVVPAGSNLIGSPAHESGRSANEGPQQPVAFRLPLAVGRSEIAFEEYLACVNEGGCPAGLPNDYGWGYGKQPAMHVSWNDAKAYVAWLSRKTGGKYRLLSEAEWEYAARGCARVCELLPFWFGIEISRDKVNYNSAVAYLGSPRGAKRERTVPINTSQPNPFGLLQVHGNVREWVEDCWKNRSPGCRGTVCREPGGIVRAGSCGAGHTTMSPRMSVPPSAPGKCPVIAGRNRLPCRARAEAVGSLRRITDDLAIEAISRHIVLEF